MSFLNKFFEAGKFQSNKPTGKKFVDQYSVDKDFGFSGNDTEPKKKKWDMSQPEDRMARALHFLNKHRDVIQQRTEDRVYDKNPGLRKRDNDKENRLLRNYRREVESGC